MKYVGGYLDLMALEADGARYELVLVAMAGEADAQRMAELEAKSRGR